MDILIELSNGKSYQVTIVGTYEDPYFCGKDVCRVLGHSDINTTLQQVDIEDKKLLIDFLNEVKDPRSTNSIGQNNLNELSYRDGKAVYINESGLYDLVLTSKVPFAKAFKKLVPHTIRKHGQFVLEETFKKQLQIKDKVIEDTTKSLEKLKKEQIMFNKFMHKVSLKQKNEWIYIATTKQYATQKIFKVGSTECLSKHLPGYQTDMYYCWTYQVHDSKKIDSIIKYTLDDFRYEGSAEMYQLHYPDLVDLVQKACDGHNDYVEYVNDFKKHRLRDSLMDEAIEVEPDDKPSLREDIISIHEKLDLIIQTLDETQGKLLSVNELIDYKYTTPELCKKNKKIEIEKLKKALTDDSDYNNLCKK